MKVFLSPTLMDTARQCPRCAYDQMILKLKRPKGPYPTLPNGMDEVLKKYTDGFRGTLPPELSHLTGRRFVEDQTLINTYRQWNGLRCTHDQLVDRPTKSLPNRKISHSLIVTGGIDDLLYNDVDEVEIIDFKTKGSEPADDYGDKYYQHTLDTYAYMLRGQGLKVSEKAYLWYWWPKGVKQDGSLDFGQKILYMTVNPDATTERLVAIANMLPAVSMEAMQYRPQSAPDCEFCTYVQTQKDHDDTE